MYKKIFVGVALALAVVFLIEMPASAVDRHVPIPYPTIQDAIDAAGPGDTIIVAAGTYREQVTINKSLELKGAGAASTTIQAPATLTGDADNCTNIITIEGSGVDVDFSGFTVSGPGPSGNLWTGIRVRDDAHANIHDNKIIDIRDVPFSGAQHGWGIMVGGGGVHKPSLVSRATAKIRENIITGYQKGGIIVGGAGSFATIEDNTITGEGYIIAPSPGPAQDGINISGEASGTITGNTITGNRYYDPAVWYGGGGSVIVWQGAHDVLIQGNMLGDPAATDYVNHFGVYLNGDLMNVVIRENKIENCKVGIQTADTSGITIEYNEINKFLVGICAHYGGATGNVIHCNSIITVPGAWVTVFNLNSGLTLDAENNWWGCSGGPDAGCAKLLQWGPIDYDPWLEGPPISVAIDDIKVNLTHHGIANSLISKLQNALNAQEKGNTKAFEKILNAFIKEVEAQSGKKIDSGYADILIGWAHFWIENPQCL